MIVKMDVHVRFSRFSPTSGYYELIRLPYDHRFSHLSIRYTTCVPQESSGSPKFSMHLLYTCHGLITPPTPYSLALTTVSTWTSSTLQFSSIGRNFIFGAIPALQDYGNPYGLCNSLCTLHLVCSLVVKKIILTIFF